MITLSIFKDLVVLMEEYQETNPSKPSTTDFVQWAFTNLIYQKVTDSDKPSIVTESIGEETSSDFLLSFLLFRSYKHVSRYSRRVLAEEGIRALDEYSMLSTIVLSKTPLTKSEIIRANLVEVPAGMEILNRLERKGWIQLDSGTVDKRSKLVNPTELGREVINRCNALMDSTAQLMKQGLDRSELQLMTRILKKVDGKQTDHYNRSGVADPRDILKKKNDTSRK